MRHGGDVGLTALTLGYELGLTQVKEPRLGGRDVIVPAADDAAVRASEKHDPGRGADTAA